MELKWC